MEQTTIMAIAENFGIPVTVLLFFFWFGVRYLWPYVEKRTQTAEDALREMENRASATQDKLVDTLVDHAQISTQTTNVLAQILEVSSKTRAAVDDATMRIQAIESKQDDIIRIVSQSHKK